MELNLITSKSLHWKNNIDLNLFKSKKRFTLEDGHERQQQRKEVDGAHVVIGFYKYVGK